MGAPALPVIGSSGTMPPPAAVQATPSATMTQSGEPSTVMPVAPASSTVMSGARVAAAAPVGVLTGAGDTVDDAAAAPGVTSGVAPGAPAHDAMSTARA